MTFQPPPPPPPPPGGHQGQHGEQRQQSQQGQQWNPPPPPQHPNYPAGYQPGYQAGWGAPPPAPQGQWGAPPPSPYGSPRPGFDPKTVHSLDWGILGAGVLAFIFSFVSYYTYTVAGIGTFSWNAWHGFFGWFAMLLALVGSAAVALELFSPQTRLPFANRLIALGAYAIATLCVILALFVVPNPGGVDEGHGFGYWISLIVILAGLVLSLMRFQQTGGQLPGRRGSYRP